MSNKKQTNEENTKLDNSQEDLEDSVKNEDYKDNYIRALADYQNLLKRVEREREEFTAYANEKLIQKILPVIDDLEKAARILQNEGITLIYNKLIAVLESEGVKKIKITETDPYDPTIMECIESEKDGTLLIELRAGYKKNGKIIRPAHVKVAKKNIV